MGASVSLVAPPVLQFFSNSGLPNVGGTLLTQVGGVNYPTYQDSAGTIALPHPIPLNSRGEVSNAAGVSSQLFLVQGVTYAFTLFDALGNQIDTFSYMVGIFSSALSGVGYALASVYGVVGDGVTDDTVAVRAAVASGKRIRWVGSVGQTIYIKGAITFTSPGVIYEGDGRDITTFKVDSAFNLAASGVFILTTGEPATIFRGFKMTAVQPDTAVRAKLVAYPPAITAVAQPRLLLEDMKITQFMTGLSLIGGNSGGFTTDNLEMSCYTKGIDIDGALDTMRLDKVHYFPFDMTTNQQVVFNDASNIAVNSGRCDDLTIDASLFIGTHGKSVNLYQRASGATIGTCTNSDFDTYGGINVAGGNMTFSGCLATIGDTGQQAIVVTSGSSFDSFVKWSGGEIEGNVATTNAFAEVKGVPISQGNALVIDGTIFRLTGDMVAAKVSATNNDLTITGCKFFATPNSSPVNPVIWSAAGGRLTATGNRISDKGTGTGTFIKLDADDQHVVTGNAFTGWGLVNVNPQNLAEINNNSGVDAWITTFVPVVTAGTGTFTSVAE